MSVFLLFVTHPTGVVQVLSFPTRFDRALEAIHLSSQPVTLRAVDY